MIKINTKLATLSVVVAIALGGCGGKSALDIREEKINATQEQNIKNMQAVSELQAKESAKLAAGNARIDAENAAKAKVDLVADNAAAGIDLNTTK